MIKEYFDLPDSQKRILIDRVSQEKNLHVSSMEKDLWVTAVLQAVTELPYSGQIQFKGGTSLSKCWKLIERFSEDIDLVVEKELLGFSGELSKSQVSDKLRRKAKSFTVNELSKDIKDKLIQLGVPNDAFQLSIKDNGIPTQDPVQLEIAYDSIYTPDSYIRPIVLVEASGRSLNLALTECKINSFVGETVPSGLFHQNPFAIKTVLPERTFIEKVCLIHEEFHQPQHKVRSDRMSRHLYDLCMMENAGVGIRARQNEDFFKDIIKHRFIYNRIDGVDYNTERPGQFDIVPRGTFNDLWKKDYEETMSKMIYGKNRMSYIDIRFTLEYINDRLNDMRWKEVPCFEPGKKPTFIKTEEIGVRPPGPSH